MPFVAMETTPTRLRQIALVAKDLERTRHLLTTVIGTEVIFEDPLVAQFGLKNFLVAVGGDIIEVVSPFKSGTAAGRQLEKCGDGGYMIIMQTLNALARRDYIQGKGLGKVIFTHEAGDSVCVQYHPKGVRGGVIPELDSHTLSHSNPSPLTTLFSPWHACGPLDTYPTYSEKMRRNGDLHLLGTTLRLKAGETNTRAAAKQWEYVFGIPRNGNIVKFTNATMDFVKGEQGKSEGITEVKIGVEGKKRMQEILWRAKLEGLNVNPEGVVNMLGVRWRFVLVGGEKSRL